MTNARQISHENRLRFLQLARDGKKRTAQQIREAMGKAKGWNVTSFLEYLASNLDSPRSIKPGWKLRSLPTVRRNGRSWVLTRIIKSAESWPYIPTDDEYPCWLSHRDAISRAR